MFTTVRRIAGMIIKDWKKEIFTIPNLLSLFRLLLIPVYVTIYLNAKSNMDYFLAAGILAVSCLTDMIDGKIARHFNMISTVGKVLDPLADKLTQAAMLACLLTRFPLMVLPLGIMVVKEIFMGITGLLVIRKTGSVFGADWHGKVTTWLLYAMMVLHLFWYNIPAQVSQVLIGICVVMMLLSLVIYGSHHIRALKKK